MLRANLTATYLLCRSALPRMLAAGQGTFSGRGAGDPGCAAYTPAKGRVLGLVRTLAAEARGRGVRVALCPGAVDPPFWDGIPGAPPRIRMLGLEAIAEAALLVLTQPPGTFVEEIVLAPTPGVV